MKIFIVILTNVRIENKINFSHLLDFLMKGWQCLTSGTSYDIAKHCPYIVLEFGVNKM